MKKRYLLHDSFQYFFSIITIFVSILTLYSFFNKEKSIIITHFYGIIALIIIFYIEILKLRKISFDRIEIFSSVFHKFTHYLRDEHNALQLKQKKGDLYKDLFIKHIEKIGLQAVNLLSEALSVSTRKEVHVCIKHFKIDELTKTEKGEEKDLYVETLCRSTNSSNNRFLNNCPSKIGDNTDFYEIMVNNEAHFAESNLKLFSKKLKKITGKPYKNSTLNWKDFYLSTIVAPIRIGTMCSKNGCKYKSYDIVGFLCADSMSTSAFRKKDLDCYRNLVKSFADALYKYFAFEFSKPEEQPQNRNNLKKRKRCHKREEPLNKVS